MSHEGIKGTTLACGSGEPERAGKKGSVEGLMRSDNSLPRAERPCAPLGWLRRGGSLREGFLSRGRKAPESLDDEVARDTMLPSRESNRAASPSAYADFPTSPHLACRAK